MLNPACWFLSGTNNKNKLSLKENNKLSLKENASTDQLENGINIIGIIKNSHQIDVEKFKNECPLLTKAGTAGIGNEPVVGEDEGCKLRHAPSSYEMCVSSWWQWR